MPCKKNPLVQTNGFFLIWLKGLMVGELMIRESPDSPITLFPFFNI